ncbi:hypothetical protein DPMN_041463 [Dreissena polymorpha]|uniref:Uncharacterized protein n=2 Tax=Dreissena polymorpha TaxID=45954 RepID=A0A9D4D090_DREPO|nr:hypothetical protein DPMN_041463 [Dreissena polymorpha]
MMEDDLQKVTLDLLGRQSSTLLDSEPESSKRFEKIKKYSTGAKIALGLTSPLWMPLGVIVIGVGMPIKIGVDYITDKMKIKKFCKKSANFIEEWIEEILKEHFNTEKLNEMVHSRYMSRLRRHINDMFNDTVPAKIASNRMLILIITAETRSAAEVHQEFNATKERIHLIKRQMETFKGNFLIDQSEIY